MTPQPLCLGLMMLFAHAGTAPVQETRLLRHPAVSRELVAFEYAGDLWVVSRAGARTASFIQLPVVGKPPVP